MGGRYRDYLELRDYSCNDSPATTIENQILVIHEVIYQISLSTIKMSWWKDISLWRSLYQLYLKLFHDSSKSNFELCSPQTLSPTYGFMKWLCLIYFSWSRFLYVSQYYILPHRISSNILTHCLHIYAHVIALTCKALFWIILLVKIVLFLQNLEEILTFPKSSLWSSSWNCCPLLLVPGAFCSFI